ncbi:DUF2798 domain-containing protein [Streptococcus moroccensis]|uniref:DUF2798 domain-containing protein n=1 Tax=Streptococcus moroccensis TaxID=1451356 RepID=A0ABT9YNN1_9STRE|nr:DUF2798 domain-containing protein [Streptococcus moroccensis]MDQ0221594.1 hypothetical protein [Streptococcus moroccensis]
MPRNFKEAMIFTCLMCGMMVFGMSIWNLVVSNHFSWGNVLSGYIPGFIVAFALDTILVGPLAKKVAFASLSKIEHHDKRWVKIVAISGCMVLGMVTCMSLYGLIFNIGLAGFSWPIYGQIWLTNFIVALPLNFLIVGPLARFILGNLQKPLPGEDIVEDFDNDEELPTII